MSDFPQGGGSNIDATKVGVLKEKIAAELEAIKEAKRQEAENLKAKYDAIKVRVYNTKDRNDESIAQINKDIEELTVMASVIREIMKNTEGNVLNRLPQVMDISKRLNELTNIKNKMLIDNNKRD